MSGSTTYAPGETLRVILDPANVIDINQHGEATLAVGSYRPVINLTSPSVRVERKWPAYGRPRTGDVWENDHGMRLFVIGDEPYTEMRSQTGDVFGSVEGALAAVGPMRRVFPPPPAPAADVDEPDADTARRAAAAALLRHIADGVDAGLHVPYTVQNFDIGLFGDGASSNPEAAIAWTTHLDPTGQTVVDVDRSSLVAKLDWRGCKIKVWTPAPKPAEPTEPEARHYQVSGQAGPAGSNGAECACGLGFYGFDTHAEAVALLEAHIANPEGDVSADEEPSVATSGLSS